MNGNGTCTLKVRQRTRQVLEDQQQAFRDDLISVSLIDLTEAAVQAFAGMSLGRRKAALKAVMERNDSDAEAGVDANSGAEAIPGVL